MNAIEQFEFDRLGYLVIKGMLTDEQTQQLASTIDELESHALANLQKLPRKKAPWGNDYHQNAERHYHAAGSNENGKTLMIEDFWNASPVFDLLVNHPKTMEYIRNIVQGKLTINNSEIRIRYPGNATGAHMGGPIDHKYRYAFSSGRMDCMMVRMVYFVHDVNMEQGPFSVVPATHKTNFGDPYKCKNPDEEPGMIGLEVKKGDAILFTENLRHGGLTNRSQQTRKTIHVGYGPAWMMSQNIATMEEPPYIVPETFARLSPEQGNLFRAWPRT